MGQRAHSVGQRAHSEGGWGREHIQREGGAESTFRGRVGQRAHSEGG